MTRETRSSKLERWRTVLDVAHAWFIRNLWHESIGMRARTYLAGRDIHSEIGKPLGIGYAPPEWDALVSHIDDLGYHSGLYSLQDAEAMGVVIPRSSGSTYYDRFRSRIIFPVQNLTGQVVAFVGRILPDDATEVAKYLYPTETPMYCANRSLLGLSQASQAIHDTQEVVVVEGVFDLAYMHARGNTNTVATVTPSLTAEQEDALKGIGAKRIIRLK